MKSVVSLRLGGHPALDFVNTVDSWTRPIRRDDLETFASVVAWAAQMGLLPEDEAERLVVLPDSATRQDYAEAVVLRTQLERMFGAIIDGHAPAPVDLDGLNALLAEARAGQRLVVGEGHYAFAWTAPVTLRTPMLLVVLAAADLLVGGDLVRLKRCPGPDGCGWLFLDESRNRSRRWCSMELCGNIVKARRFQATHRHRH